MTTKEAPYKCEPAKVTCHYCPAEFIPSGHNYRHLGGVGDITVCNFHLRSNGEEEKEILEAHYD